MHIRKATPSDIPAVTAIYDALHSAEETGAAVIGWNRSVYPTRTTAEAALARGDLFVQEDGRQIIGAAVINQVQVDVYAEGSWQYPAAEDEVLVLHTLVIDPAAARKGCGSAFVAFYEDCARTMGCRVLRMDTNARNTAARSLYHRLGYREADIVSCVFNGLEGVQLVLLEKQLR